MVRLFHAPPLSTRLRRLRLSDAPCVRALALIVVAPFAFATPLAAQNELKSQVANNISYRADGLPIGPGGPPSGEPAITPQFANVVETSASAGPIAASSSLTARYPNSGSVVLQHASVGHSFSSGVPRYFLGDRIAPPSSYLNSAGAIIPTAANFWRAEPIRAGEIVTNPSGLPLVDSSGQPVAHSGGVIVPALAPNVFETFYYSRHAKAVFACQPGQVQIWWRSSLPDPSGNYVLVQEIFSVSSATSSAVRTLYWTEKSFNGPRVTIPSGRIVTVNPVYSNVFPATVETEYSAVGASPPADPDAEPASELRTLWFEKTNGIGELHAYNISGRVLIEYLGALRDDGSHEFLGADIVEVAPAAEATTVAVFLGNEIRPALDDRTLVALPATTSADAINYYGSVARPDGSLAYYAERENLIEDRIVFYWLESHDAAITPASGEASGLRLDWPKYLHKYLQIWPDDVSTYAHYVVAGGGSSLESGTGLKFEGGNLPTLVYQDDAEQDEAAIDAVTQRLLVDLGGDQLNRTLLRFTGTNGSVWYVRLMTQAADRDGFLEGDNGAPLTATAYVGERIEPPSADYTVAGYIASGTAYSPSAYRDPFSVGVTSAQKGAIIPVNALPGGASQLEVWWFKKIAAPSAEFSDLYTPAKVGRYTLAWRDDNPTIVLASNAGSGDLAPDQVAGRIYVQNDAALPGYNPNEEHALVLSGRAYALRDDLNITTGASFTSQPRVLLEYTKSSDGRPAMSVWKVVREDETHKFVYNATAPTILNSPMPLPRLALPIDSSTGLSRNTEVTPDADLYPPETLSADAPSHYRKFTFSGIL